MSKQIIFYNASISIDSIISDIQNVQFGKLDIQPSYQRGYIWNNEFKDKLIFSITKNYPIGNITIRLLEQRNDKGALQEVVDGQQRLRTIYNFISGDYEIKGTYAIRIIKEINNIFKQANVVDVQLDKLNKKLSDSKTNKITLKYKELPDVIKDNFKKFNIALIQISKIDDKQIREYFRFLQNQERLRAGEIIKSMPSSNLENILDKISDKKKLLNIIGFQDERAEFDKIFYSIIGFFDYKINFGITDRGIQEYAYKADIPTIGIDNIEKMIKQLNYVIEYLKYPVLSNTRKRYLKYLLLLTGFGYIDLQNNTIEILKTLKNIDDKLSSFFSAKADIVQNTYIDYSDDVIEELRLVALISKGAHSYKRVENRMQILSYYVQKQSKTTTSNIKIIE